MSTNGQTSWRIKGDHAGSCNCIWACPCQFNGLPDKGNCEAFLVWEIRDGHFGDLSLDGVRFGFAVHWPGAIHEGNGTRQIVVDEGASDEQRQALESMMRGEQGGPYFEIFASVCPNEREPTVAKIELDVDRESRRGTFRIAGLGEGRVEPIINPEISELSTGRGSIFRTGSSTRSPRSATAPSGASPPRLRCRSSTRTVTPRCTSSSGRTPS